MWTTFRRIGLVALVLLTLPILLHVYNPSMQLGGLGIGLGIIGKTLSPLILYVVLVWWLMTKW